VSNQILASGSFEVVCNDDILMNELLLVIID